MVRYNRYNCNLSQLQANKSTVYKHDRGQNTIRTSDQFESIAYILTLMIIQIDPYDLKIEPYDPSILPSNNSLYYI